MVYDKRSRSWCHRLVASVLSLTMALGVTSGLTVPAFAASTGNNNPWGEYTCDPSAAITIPPNTDPNIIARVYPVEYDESINGGEAGAIDVPEDVATRWMYAGSGKLDGADYALYAHMPGHTLEYQQMFHPRMFIDGGAIKWAYDTKGIQGLFITPVKGDNVFMDWLAEGLSVGINTDNPSATSIGVALKDKFYGEIATDEARGQEFWESYFSVFLGKYPGNEQMVDGWRELLAQNKLSLIVDVNVPMSVKTNKGVQQGYLNITQFLGVHRTIADRIVGIDPKSEKAYTDAMAGSLACWGSSGGGGSPPCTNLRCINSGHLRFAMGLVTNILVDVIRPDDASNKVTGLSDRYGSWGYFHCGADMQVPAVQLIEQWQYYDGGVKVHEDEKFRKSYDTLTIFKQSGDADRNADETSRWGGDDFTFNEYSYTITEVDTGTGADKDVLDPPGRPESSEPQITVSTDEMQANKAYKIVVIAKYVKENEIDTAIQPTRVEEWEFSQFWNSLAQFTENGQLKSDNIVVTASLNSCTLIGAFFYAQNARVTLQCYLGVQVVGSR